MDRVRLHPKAQFGFGLTWSRWSPSPMYLASSHRQNMKVLVQTEGFKLNGGRACSRQNMKVLVQTEGFKLNGGRACSRLQVSGAARRHPTLTLWIKAGTHCSSAPFWYLGLIRDYTIFAIKSFDCSLRLALTLGTLLTPRCFLSAGTERQRLPHHQCG
jgi:hypothetical protein